MKKLLVLFSLILVAVCPMLAQLSAVDYTSENFTRFKASKTYFVKTGDAKFDAEMTSAMAESWKITPYEILESKDLKAKLPDQSASFILSIIIETTGPYQSYHYLALVNGGKKKLDNYSYESMLAYCPINHFGGEVNNTDCSYRVRNMLESMVLTIDLVQKNDIKGSSKKIADKLKEIYNGRSPQIKDRTLLVCEDQNIIQFKDKKANGISKQEFGGLYPYKFEFVSQERLEQVIKEKSKEYYYMQPASTLNKSMFVFDPSNGEVVYFSYKVSGAAIDDKDVKDLVAKIKGQK